MVHCLGKDLQTAASGSQTQNLTGLQLGITLLKDKQFISYLAEHEFHVVLSESSVLYFNFGGMLLLLLALLQSFFDLYICETEGCFISLVKPFQIFIRISQK